MDWHLFLLVNNLAGHWHGLDLIMRWIAVYTPLLFLAPLVYFWFGSGREARVEKRVLVLRAVAAATLALAGNALIGTCYYRPRPFVSHGIKLLLPHSADASFPSDHAAGAWALAWGLRSQAVHYALMGLALMVMVARVYVGIHYPSDVIGGALVGMGASIAVERLWPRVEAWAKRLALLLP